MKEEITYMKDKNNPSKKELVEIQKNGTKKYSKIKI
jgi:hypothetical protein